MEDGSIVQLYWDRDEQAIPATAEKYGNYCASIAKNILDRREDAEECVNDTYMSAWNAMPPHRPQILSAFLGKLTRNLSLNRYKQNTAGKRGGGEAPVVFEEIAELVSDTDSVEQEIGRRELASAIDSFLGGLSAGKRSIFVCRYWYFDSISTISKQFGFTGSKVKSILYRTRKKLLTYLD